MARDQETPTSKPPPPSSTSGMGSSLTPVSHDELYHVTPNPLSSLQCGPATDGSNSTITVSANSIYYSRRCGPQSPGGVSRSDPRDTVTTNVTNKQCPTSGNHVLPTDVMTCDDYVTHTTVGLVLAEGISEPYVSVTANCINTTGSDSIKPECNNNDVSNDVRDIDGYVDQASLLTS